MNKTEQAQQLRLAADIFETGHPFEVRHDTSEKWHPSRVTHQARAVLEGWHLRPILATPPDNRPLHNPDGLSAEQVGIGYRLALIDEKTNENEALQEFWNKGKWMTSGRVYSDTFGESPNRKITYRLPLSVPWPEAKPDPYAELKAAHAAGKTIEVQMPNGEWFDYKPGDPQWNLQPECYRIKPEPATKTVELGPEDVSPLSVIRRKGEKQNWHWRLISYVHGTHAICADRAYEWSELERDYEINRSISLAGKWDPTAWEPCHKTIPAR